MTVLYFNGEPMSVSNSKQPEKKERKENMAPESSVNKIIKNVLLQSAGSDAPTGKNEHGGLQSKTQSRLDLVPPLALLHIGKIVQDGAIKYAIDNWRLIPPIEHLNHALIHAQAYLVGDREDDHAGHFACRALMFLETTITESLGEQWYGKSTERRTYKPDMGNQEKAPAVER